MTDYTELVKALRETATFTKFDDLLSKREQKLESLAFDAAAAIEALQAEVKRLKEANDELREAQTYIDHYGDKWLTSAKDVPTSAYNHGYMDGKNEAEQALEPKRGEWLPGREISRSYIGDCCVSIDFEDWRCSICGNIIEIPCNPKYKYCPNCGAKMTEVQE